MNVCPECGQTFPEGGFCTQDGTPLASGGGDPLLGTMLGPYRVAHLVGLGGMGRVYKGVNPTIRSRVAIKVLSHDCADRPELVERFFAEARAVNLIRHESIVNILDLARLPDGRPYIVMEFLDGAPLSQIMAVQARIPLGTLARIVTEVLDGLAAAHSKGIVHRDLKPDNVFVTRQGRAKVLDFGVAKLASEQREGMSPTLADSLLGTPHYMSPEQAQSRPVDARADLYAIGVILYEAATGQKPLDGDSVFEILRKQVEDQPLPPRRFVPDMPPAYERLIMRAMAKDPARRWQSADELARALGDAIAGLPAPAWSAIGDRTRPDSVGPPTPIRTPESQKRPSPRRSRAPLVAAAAIALLGASIAALVVSQPDEEAAPPAVSAAPPAVAEPASPTPGDALTEKREIVAAAAGPAEAREDGGPGEESSSSERARPRRKRPSPVEDRAAAPEAPEKRAPGKPATEEPAQGGAPAADAATALQSRMSAWDVSGYLPRALAQARKKFPDAVLARIDADGVYPTGKADLTLDEGFSVLYRFVSPSRARRPADLPQGVQHKPTCMYYVLINRGSVSTYPLEGWSCDDHPPIRMPRCSAKQIWRRAAALGAPTRNAVASLSFRSNQGSEPRWWFSIGRDHQHTFDDDC